MLWKLTQRAFNGGQLDGRLMGRTDIAKYYEGASVLRNFIVKRQGCIVKRRGTIEIANFTTATGCTSIIDYRLFPFTFENEYGYVVALVHDTNNGTRCYVFAKDGALKATLTTLPYLAGDFNKISFDQSGDMLYLAHESYPFARITRYAETNWRYEVVDFSTCGHDSLPETPVITNVEKLPIETWEECEGPEKTIYYIVTAVKDGVESRPSVPYKMTYNTPWPEGASIKITIGVQNPVPDGYNVYKKSDSYTGLIGTTYTGSYDGEGVIVNEVPYEENLTVYFYQLQRSVCAGTQTRYQAWSNTEVNDLRNLAYLAENGVYRVEFETAQEADSFTLSLGYVWWGLDQRDGWSDFWRKGIQRLPCNVDFITPVVTYEDDTEETLQSRNVPEGTKTSQFDNTVLTEWNSGASMVNEKRAELSKGATLLWAIQNRTKKVKAVTFTAYVGDSNSSVVATGSIGAMNMSTGATVTGHPFVISGFWAKRKLVDQSNTVIDEYITPDASLAPPKYEVLFSTNGNYPGCVSIYQQRLVLARTYNQPFTFWMSCIGDLYNFNVHDSIREDDAIEVTLPATKYPEINHMVLNRDLIMFCDSGEWVVAPSSGTALTYKTVSTKIQSQIGCSKTIKPLSLNDDVIFANMTAETLVATKYSYATDGYESTDLSVLSQDIFRGNAITSIAYKQHPDSIIVATLADGTFATLEYMKEHEVVAWSHHELAGCLKARYCCADGSTTKGTTDVYILAEDTSAVGQQFYLLRVKDDSKLNTVANAVSMDQMKTVEVGDQEETVNVPDGFVAVNALTGATVAAGGTLSVGNTYVLGRPFEAMFVSVKPEPGPNETVQFEIKNPTEVEIRVSEGSTFKVGQYGLGEDRDRTVRMDPTVTPATGAVALKTEDRSTLISGANNRDGRIRLTSDGVWPLTVLSLSTTYQIEQANQESEGKGD